MRSQTVCFYKKKYHTMLLTGTFAMAIIYIMLLSDNIIAGLMIGKDAVAAINIIAPLISVSMAISLCVSEGTSVLYSRAIGKMSPAEFNQDFLELLVGVVRIGQQPVSDSHRHDTVVRVFAIVLKQRKIVVFGVVELIGRTYGVSCKCSNHKERRIFYKYRKKTGTMGCLRRETILNRGPW